jgi:hypothetical protein
LTHSRTRARCASLSNSLCTTTAPSLCFTTATAAETISHNQQLHSVPTAEGERKRERGDGLERGRGGRVQASGSGDALEPKIKKQQDSQVSTFSVRHTATNETDDDESVWVAKRDRERVHTPPQPHDDGGGQGSRFCRRCSPCKHNPPQHTLLTLYSCIPAKCLGKKGARLCLHTLCFTRLEKYTHPHAHTPHVRRKRWVVGGYARSRPTKRSLSRGPL